MTAPSTTVPDFYTASNGVQVLKRAEGHYIALSRTVTIGSYDVRHWQYKWECSCPRYKYHKGCAHVAAVLEAEGYSICPDCGTFKETADERCMLCEARYADDSRYSIEEALEAQGFTAGADTVALDEAPGTGTQQPNAPHVLAFEGAEKHDASALRPGDTVSFRRNGKLLRGKLIGPHMYGGYKVNVKGEVYWVRDSGALLVA